MNPLTPVPNRPLAINLNTPGSYMHWSIFTISVANFVLIAVMVVIFGAALLLPFPGHRKAAAAPADPGPDSPLPGSPLPGSQLPGSSLLGAPVADAGPDLSAGAPPDEDPDSRMWTSIVRRKALALLPPGKLLPDRQPAYVASWIYVFGVASLASFAIVIASGFTIALGGTDWWHTNPVGHFCNSLHLWSVELFMAFMVIHLWGKFWMAAWRGRRALTWMTGVIAFGASVVECFSGYLSQQNFDSQWIATNGKDAFNAVGVGAFFNLMNFGQMLLWHVVLLPLVLVALIGAHVLLVRIRGVVTPLPAAGPRRPRRADLSAAGLRAMLTAGRARRQAEAAPWRGATRQYDILKEGSIAALVAVVLTVGLASLLSSPDDPPATVRSWVQVAPADFLATAATELAGTSVTAGYGPPYNTNGTPQSELFAPARIAGVRQPIDTAQTFVLQPLAKSAPTDPPLAAALAAYNSASAAQQAKWTDSYGKAVLKVTFVHGAPVLPAAADGPVPMMLATELSLARSGALDGDLSAQQPFYGTDFTKPLLFLNDGQYYADKAAAMNLTGNQWGVMNETGSYPGQPWLWLYQLWYHIPGWRNSLNLDLIAIYMTSVATLLLLFIPFIPGLRDIPRWIPVHRLIWRRG
jgi:hypothetical protein